MTTPNKKDPWYQKPGPKYKRRTILTTAALRQFQPIIVPQQVSLDNLVMEENVTVDPFTGVVTVSGIFSHVMRGDEYQGNFEVWSPNNALQEITQPQIGFTHLVANVVKRQSNSYHTGRCPFPTSVRNELIGQLLSVQFTPVTINLEYRTDLTNAPSQSQASYRAYLYDREADFNPLFGKQQFSAFMNDAHQFILYANDNGSKISLTRYQYRFIPNYDNALAVDLITLHENFENGQAFKQTPLRQPENRATDDCLVNGHITLKECHQFRARMYPYNRYHLRALDENDMKTNYVVGQTYSIGECFGFIDERIAESYKVEGHSGEVYWAAVSPATDYISRPKDKLYEKITQFYRSKGYGTDYTKDAAYVCRNYAVSDFNQFKLLAYVKEWLLVDNQVDGKKRDIINGENGWLAWLTKSTDFDHQNIKKFNNATHVGIFGKYELVNNTDFRAPLIAIVPLLPKAGRNEITKDKLHYGRPTYTGTNKLLYLKGNKWRRQPYKSTSLLTVTSNEDKHPDSVIEDSLTVPYFQPPTREEWPSSHPYPAKLWGDEYWNTFKRYYFDLIKQPIQRGGQLLNQNTEREYTKYTENENYNHRKPFWMHFEKVGDKYLFPFGVLDHVWEEGKFPNKSGYGSNEDINKEWLKTKEAEALEPDFTELVRGALAVVDSFRRGKGNIERKSLSETTLLTRWYNYRVILDTFLPDSELGDLSVPLNFCNPENKDTIYKSAQLSKGVLYPLWYSNRIVNPFVPTPSEYTELQLAGLNIEELNKSLLEKYSDDNPLIRGVYEAMGDTLLTSPPGENRNLKAKLTAIHSSEYTFEKYSMLEFLGVAMMADHVVIEIDGETFDLPGATLVPNPKRIIDYFLRDKHILTRRHNGNNWDNEFVEHLVKRHDPWGWISRDVQKYYYDPTHETISLIDPKVNMNQYIHQHPYEKDAWNEIGRKTEMKIDLGEEGTEFYRRSLNIDHYDDTIDRIKLYGEKPPKMPIGDTSFLNDYFPRLIECLDIAVPHVYGAVALPEGYRSGQPVVAPPDGSTVNTEYSRNTLDGNQHNARYLHKLIHTDFGVNIFEGDIENKSRPLRQQLPEGEYYDTIARLATHFPVRGKKMVIKFLWSKPYSTNLVFTFPYQSSEKQMWIPPMGTIYPNREYQVFYGDASYNGYNGQDNEESDEIAPPITELLNVDELWRERGTTDIY